MISRAVLLTALVFVMGGCLQTPLDHQDSHTPPTDPEALQNWLIEGHYKTWESESRVRDREGFSGAKVFLNPTLAQSLAEEGTEQHFVGAAAVRELYEADLKTLRGFALALKVSETGPGQKDDWYWYEIFIERGVPQVAETGAGACASCHTQGQDFIQSSYPLQ